MIMIIIVIMIMIMIMITPRNRDINPLCANDDVPKIYILKQISVLELTTLGFSEVRFSR